VRDPFPARKPVEFWLPRTNKSDKRSHRKGALNSTYWWRNTRRRAPWGLGALLAFESRLCRRTPRSGSWTQRPDEGSPVCLRRPQPDITSREPPRRRNILKMSALLYIAIQKLVVARASRDLWKPPFGQEAVGHACSHARAVEYGASIHGNHNRNQRPQSNRNRLGEHQCEPGISLK
jgi:hypothetical protein